MTPPVPTASPSWALLAILVILLIVAVSVTRRMRRGNHARWDVKVCDRCGASQPPQAAYCRQCGSRLAA